MPRWLVYHYFLLNPRVTGGWRGCGGGGCALKNMNKKEHSLVYLFRTSPLRQENRSISSTSQHEAQVDLEISNTITLHALIGWTENPGAPLHAMYCRLNGNPRLAFKRYPPAGMRVCSIYKAPIDRKICSIDLDRHYVRYAETLSTGSKGGEPHGNHLIVLAVWLDG